MSKTRMPAIRLRGLVVVAAVMGLAAFACSSGGGDGSEGGGAGGVGVATESQGRAPDPAGPRGSALDSGVLAQVGTAQQRVIKTGEPPARGPPR